MANLSELRSEEHRLLNVIWECKDKPETDHIKEVREEVNRRLSIVRKCMLEVMRKSED